MAETSGVGVTDEIDRVAEARHRRQHRPQPIADRGVERQHLEPRLASGVRGHDAEAAAVRHDEEASAPRHGLALEGVGQVKQLLDRLRANRPRLADGGVEGRVGAGEGARVRGHGAGALGRAPGLEEDDRLEGRGFAERRGERAPVGHALEVGDDHPRFGVFGDRAQEFGLVEIGLVAEAREEGKPHVSVARPVEDRHRERPGVGHERDGARLGHTRREGEVEPLRRTDPAEAVRAQNPERPAAKPRAELGLAPPALVVRFAEAGRDDDGTPDPLGCAFLEGREHRRRGNRDHR